MDDRAWDYLNQAAKMGLARNTLLFLIKALVLGHVRCGEEFMERREADSEVQEVFLAEFEPKRRADLSFLVDLHGTITALSHAR